MDAFELPLQQKRNIVDNLTRLSGAEPARAGEKDKAEPVSLHGATR
jgi:hypothetical protein